MRMRRLLECGTWSATHLREIVERIYYQLVAPGTDIPRIGESAMFVAWVARMIREGDAINRLAIVLFYANSTDVLHSFLFEGESQGAVVAFLEQLETEIDTAVLGRNPDGSKMTNEQLAQSAFKKIPRVVVRMQAYSVAM